MKKTLSMILVCILVLSLAACAPAGTTESTEPKQTTEPTRQTEPPTSQPTTEPATEPPTTEPTTEPVEEPDAGLSLEQIPEKLAEIQANTEQTEEEKLQQILALLFDAARLQKVAPETVDLDFSIFWMPDSPNQTNLNYFEANVNYYKDLYAEIEINIEYSKNTQDFRSMEISEDSAFVEVYNWYEYKPSDQDYFSGEGVTYEVRFVKTEGQWLISDIEFYDEATVDLYGK